MVILAVSIQPTIAQSQWYPARIPTLYQEPTGFAPDHIPSSRPTSSTQKRQAPGLKLDGSGGGLPLCQPLAPVFHTTPPRGPPISAKGLPLVALSGFFLPGCAETQPNSVLRQSPIHYSHPPQPPSPPEDFPPARTAGVCGTPVINPQVAHPVHRAPIIDRGYLDNGTLPQKGWSKSERKHLTGGSSFLELDRI
jgi:hypothetical protein